MSSCIEKIKIDCKLNENEKMVVQYIIDHLDEVPKISSRELGRRTYMSSTAIIRLIKKMGFENYNDFKLNISSYLKNIDPASLEIGSNEDLLLLVNKLSSIEVNVIEKTKEMLSMETLKRVVDLLMSYSYIDIIATDTNASIGEYAKHLLWGLGKIVNVYKDEDVQLHYSINVPNDHVVIIISRYGKSSNTKRVVQTLLKKQIPMIALTTQNPNILNEKATFVFYGLDTYLSGPLNTIVFYISIKYLFDLLVISLYSQNQEELKKIENAIMQYYKPVSH